MIRKCYYRFLARHPYIVLGITLVIVALLGTFSVLRFPVSYWRKNLKDPTLGVEVRGSSISGRSLAVDNILNSIPETYHWLPNNTEMPEVNEPKEFHIFSDVCQRIQSRGDPWKKVKQTGDSHCRFVFEATDGKSLFSASHLRDICALEDKKIHSYFRYKCQAYSVGMFVAVLRDKTCNVITENDVTHVLELLQSCYSEYDAGLLKADCNVVDCPDASPECYQHNAVFNIFSYLTDTDFNADIRNNVSDPVLKHTMLILQDEGYSAAMRRDFFFDKLDQQKCALGTVKITGVDMGIRFDVFVHYFMRSLLFLLLSGVLMFIILASYLNSGICVLLIGLAMPFSIVTSMFFYHFVFQFRMFPFLNVMSLIVIMSVWVSNVFAFFDAWELAKSSVHLPGMSETSSEPFELSDSPSEDRKAVLRQFSESYGAILEASAAGGNAQRSEEDIRNEFDDVIEKWVAHAFSTVNVTLLATSLSTVGSMMVNFNSNVISVHCFSVFTTACLAVNMLLAYTWIPACLVLGEKLGCGLGQDCYDFKHFTCISNFLSNAKALFWAFFHKFLPFITSKLWFLHIFIATCAGIAGVLVIFLYPGLKLPTTVDFLLLKPTFKTERYALKLKYDFEFENPNPNSTQGMPLYFVWGISGRDNSDQFDAFDHGHLVQIRGTDFFSKNSQLWLTQFCEDLRAQHFVHPQFRSAKCTYPDYWEILRDDCPKDFSLDPACCGHGPGTGPVAGYLLEACLPQLAEYNNYKWMFPTLGHHLFYMESGEAVAFVIQVNSSKLWSGSYKEMDSLYSQIDDFMSTMQEDEPPELDSGWFSGAFEFYDLQKSFVSGTIFSLSASLSVAFVCMLVASRDLLISVYATFTTILSIGCTIGVLVLLGYEMSLVEACLYSLMAGITADMTINYGLVYVYSKKETRQERMKDSLRSMSVTVSMSALTTFLIGAGIVGAPASAYKDIGLFLMVLMLSSWIFATFFFQPLCYIAGPENDFLRLKCWRNFKCCSADGDSGEEEKVMKDKTTLDENRNDSSLDALSNINRDKNRKKYFDDSESD